MLRFSILILLLFLALPSLYLYIETLNINSLLLSIVPIIYLWAFVKDSRYLVILYPFVLTVPFALFYIRLYGANINEQVLSVILETNWQETLAFLGSQAYLYLGAYIAWTVGVTAFFLQNHRLPMFWIDRSRGWFIIAVSSIAIIAITIDIAMIKKSTYTDFLVEDKNSLLRRIEIKKTYPLGLVFSIRDLYHEQGKINNAFDKNSQFKFKATTSYPKSAQQLIVLVIGETSRRANWQLNGYSRKTNPLLANQTNVVNFSDMLSISNLTRSSIPMLLTRKPSELVNKYDFPEKSIISAFKEAGFHTFWLSTQQKFGRHDTSTSVYAKEADEIIFLNKTSYSNRGEKDEVVLPEFEKILNMQDKKKFVVIHTLGSHFDYSHRYPADFDIFRPSLNDLDNYSQQDQRYKEHLVNSYDNSILYTDYVLNKLIESMKNQSQTESFLLYSSDHGEDLFDGQCDKSGHAHDTIYNFKIASFAWYSDSFAENNADKIQNLKATRDNKINQTSIFPTLIDAASIAIPNYQRKRSLLNQWQPYPRLIMGSKDYDHSSPQGKCREIK